MTMALFHKAANRLDKAKRATTVVQRGSGATDHDVLVSMVEMLAAHEDLILRMAAEMDRLRWRVVALERRFR